MSHTVLVIAAHPDDEALGCAGTMARHAAAGDAVHALFMTDGVGARAADGAGATDPVARSDAAEAARRILGAQHYEYLRFPDNRMDTVPLLSIVQAIEAYAERVRPDIVYTHFCGDLNVDHQLTQKAVLTAFRPTPGQGVSRICAFEVMSSTDWSFGTGGRAFRPQYFVDISEHLDTKMQALGAYRAEMRDAPHSRSFEALENLARARGSQVGMRAAEAFEIIRDTSWS